MKQILRLTTTLIVLLFLGGSAWGQFTYTENFDNEGSWAGGAMGSYNAKTYANSSDPSNDQFSTNSAVRETSNTHSAGYAWRTSNSGNPYLRYECEETVSSFSIWMARWDNSPKPSVTIRYSINSGTSYTDIETIDGDYFTGDKIYKNYSYAFGAAISPTSGEKIYIEFYTNSGERMLYDDFEMSYGETSIPTLTVNPSILTGFTYVLGSGPSAEQSFTVEGTNLTNDISILAPTNYEISTGTGGAFSPANPITLTQTSGEVGTTPIYVRLKAGLSVGNYDSELITATSTGATDKTVTCSGSVTAPPAPTITLSETALIGFTYLEGGGPSSEQTFTVEGSNLTAYISISAPTNYEISTGTGGAFSPVNPIILAHSSGTVSSTTIYVRLKAGLSAGAYNDEDITASSAGATDKTLTCSGSVTIAGVGGGLEDFTNSNATTSYADGSFVGNNGITWTYVQSRDENGDANNSGINGKALMLRRVADNSSVTSESISGGIGNFSVKLYKGFTSNNDRQVELFINGVSKGTSTPFNDYNEHVFTVDNINVTGEIVIQIKNVTAYQVIVDDITWTEYSGGSGVDAPTAFSATANGSDQIDLSWAENAAGNAVLMAWSTDGNFGDPADGTTYANGESIPGGGTSLGTDADGAFSHTGLTPNIQYFYKIWSVDGSTNYSSGATANATTVASEPTNHPTAFTATTNTSSAITVDWTDAVPAADGYLIKGSSVSYAAIVVPVDGQAETNGALVQNVASGIETFQFTGLAASTTHYFKIYPYNGADDAINYKTDGAAQASATTLAPPVGPNAWINEIHYDNLDIDVDEFIEVVLENPGNYVLSAFDVYLVNGSNGEIYDTKTLDQFAVGASYGDFTFYSYIFSSVQNGAPDGIAIAYQGSLISGQFLSYEGTFTGVGGAVDGFTSVDIGVYETNATTLGYSLQLAGVGTTYSDFAWTTPAENTQGAINNQQSFFAATVWNGSIDTDWGKAGNWSNGLPVLASEATIPAASNLPVLSAVGSAGNLTIETGAGLTIQTSGSLTVSGTLTNNAVAANLVIKSDATGTGSLIHSMANVHATVERYITGASENWHLISSPVQSQSISGDWTPAGTYADGTGYDFYAWDEPTTAWLNQKVEANNINNFTPGKGYLVAYQATNPTKTFTGELNEGSTSLALTTSGVSTYGWSNLAGNPYPSSIDWKAASGWDFSNLYQNGGGYDLHIWNGATANYGTYNSAAAGDGGTNEASRYIAPMQGFMVKASAAGNLVMDNNVRVHSSQTFLKSTEGLADCLKLRVTSAANTYSDETIIEFNHDNQQGGASKLFSFVAEAPSLYTVKSNDYYAINFMGMPQSATAISMNFEPGQDGVYTISAFNIETFAQGTLITLEDLKAGTTHSFKEKGNYQFQASTSDDPARFKIHFAGTFSIYTPSALEGLSIYSHAGTIYFSSEKAINAQVGLYNVTGQKVFDRNMLMDGLTQINANLTTGWYIVKVSTQEGIATQKVFIQAN
jgi:hypothetical protein